MNIVNIAKKLKHTHRRYLQERRATALGRVGRELSDLPIYDAFLVNDEMDILDLRFEMLYQAVSKFVVVESSKTFSGSDKPCFFAQNLPRFERFMDKVIHIVLHDIPDQAYEDNPNNPGTLVSEFWQRNQIMQGLGTAKDDDWILISDLDEIPNPRILETIMAKGPKDRQVILRQDWRLFYFDLKVKDSYWLGTHMLTRRALRDRYDDTPNLCWAKRWFKNDEVHASNGGWHLSYMGGVKCIASKFKSCGHPQKSAQYIIDLNNFRLNGKYNYYHHGSDGLSDEMIKCMDHNDSLRFDLKNYHQTIAALRSDL